MWLRNLKQKWSSYHFDSLETAQNQIPSQCLASNSLTVAHAAINHCYGVIEARLVLPFHHKKYWCTCHRLQSAAPPVILWKICVAGTFNVAAKAFSWAILLFDQFKQVISFLEVAAQFCNFTACKYKPQTATFTPGIKVTTSSKVSEVIGRSGPCKKTMEAKVGKKTLQWLIGI